jgi:hypothetical protein
MTIFSPADCAIFLAIRPYVQAKQTKALMPEPIEGAKDWSASNNWPRDDGLGM